MADPFDSKSGPPDEDDAGSAYEQEPMEVEDAPRRAASARFIVDSEVGSEAAMRDAMDPANQSLAEALRLSFRVLQLVILVMIALFMVSSFDTVNEDESGVFTRWGAIQNLDETEALVPGLKWGKYPYPVGEFVIIGIQNRTVDISTAFMPMQRPGVTREQMMEAADVSTPLFPGQDGSLLTRDGDLGHMRLSARYEIVDPAKFVRRMDDGDAARSANTMLRLAVQRAAIHVTAAVSVQDVVDMTEDTRSRMQQAAQKMLDDMDAGVHLVQLEVRDPSPAYAIMKVFTEVTNTKNAAREAVEAAQLSAKEELNRVAGAATPEILELIAQYDTALDRNDSPASAELLAKIYARLESQDAAGTVAEIISSARSYQDQIDSTLGNEVRRFESLLPSYRENPDLFVRKQWTDMLSEVYARKDIEIVWVPPTLAAFQMHLSGSYIVQDIRRRADQQRRENESLMQNYDPNSPYILRAEDMTIGGPGRQMKVKDGKVMGAGQK